METLRVYWLAVKYWLRGDSMADGFYYANLLVNGWKESHKKTQEAVDSIRKRGR